MGSAPARPRRPSSVSSQGRKGRSAQGALVPSLRQRRFRRGFAENHACDSGARSHQGARQHRRAAVPRSCDGAQWSEAAKHYQWAFFATSGGGRYGLSSKEFTPAMVKAVFDELKKETPRSHFTMGINDDVTHSSLEYDPEFSTESAERSGNLLWFGFGRHRRREQELDHHHR